MIDFVWDDRQNSLNTRKHGIPFPEAKTVFYDENAVRYFDPGHSDREDRYLIMGISNRLRVLVVSHCFREEESIIRIISARKATKREEEVYWRGQS